MWVFKDLDIYSIFVIMSEDWKFSEKMLEDFDFDLETFEMIEWNPKQNKK